MTFGKHRKSQTDWAGNENMQSRESTGDGIWFSAGRPQFKVRRKSTEY